MVGFTYMNEVFNLSDSDVDKYQYSINCLANADGVMNILLNLEVLNSLSKREVKKLIDSAIAAYSKGDFLKNDTIAHIKSLSGFNNFDIDIVQKKAIKK